MSEPLTDDDLHELQHRLVGVLAGRGYYSFFCSHDGTAKDDEGKPTAYDDEVVIDVRVSMRGLVEALRTVV